VLKNLGAKKVNNKADNDRKVREAHQIAYMATDTLGGMNKADRILEQYKSGLITASEAIRLL